MIEEIHWKQLAGMLNCPYVGNGSTSKAKKKGWNRAIQDVTEYLNSTNAKHKTP